MRIGTGTRLAAASAFTMMLTASPLTARAEVAGGVIDCDAPGNKQVGGALVGALLGGVAGSNLAKHDRQTGTVVGAAAGAATGSYVGCKMQKDDAARPAPVVVRERPVVVERERTVVVRDDEPVYVERRGDADDEGFVDRKHHRMPPGLAKRYYGVGERLPVTYVRERRYTIYEPRRYGLRYAPAGYQWVVVDRDAYLVRTRSGMIADVVRAIVG